MDISSYVLTIYNGLGALWDYIKENSIDFIAIIASIIIAVQTDKWIENRKDREEKKYLLKELLKEIGKLLGSLKNDEIINNDNIRCDKITLKMYPYETPLWESVKNTERIELITECKGYNEVLQFYDDIGQLNAWENLLTSFILFSEIENKRAYQESLLEQIIEQRRKCINLAEKAQEKLREEG